MFILPIDTILYWRDTNKPAYQKTSNDECGWWRSLELNLNKPLIERYGFKWNDELIIKHNVWNIK